MRQLEYFVAVADELSFSRGAARVHVVQPAVSSAVAKLERDLGVTLIDRSRLRITLTAPGAAFLVEARATLDAARRARETATSFDGKLSGTVDLGTLQSSGGIDVPAVLSWFHETHPLVSVRLRQNVGGSSDHLAAVADGSMDLALVALTGKAPNGVTARVLSSEPLLFVCWPGHPLADRAHVSPADLAGDTVVGYPRGWGVRRLTDEAFADAGVDPAVPYEVSDYRTAAGLVRHRLGVTLMPATEATRLDGLRVLPLQPAVMWNVHLATAGPQRSSAAARALAEAFVDDAGRRTAIGM